MKLKNQLISLALTLVLAVILLPTTALADVSDSFIYEHEGVTLEYFVISENPNEVAVIYHTDPSLLAATQEATSITVPSQVTNSDNSISYTVTTLGFYNNWGAFFNLTELESITLPETLTQIEDKAFQGCIGLTSISIPDGVTHIGIRAFDEALKLESVDLPASLTHLGENAFSSCESLQSIFIPNGVSEISASTFERCTALDNVILPYSLDYIGEDAFKDCTSLENISMPVYVGSIAHWAFAGCEALESISLPQNLQSIGTSAFEGCSALKSITIPDNVTTIESSAFKDCAVLTSVTLPDNLINIKSSAFENCSSLESISIPSSFERLESNAFAECYSLKSVYFDGEYPSISSSSFDSISSDAEIYYNPRYIGSWDGKSISSIPIVPASYPDGLLSYGDDPYEVLGFDSIEVGVSTPLPVSYNGYKLVWRVSIGDAVIIDNSLIVVTPGQISLRLQQLAPLETPAGSYSNLTSDGSKITTKVAIISATPSEDTDTDTDTGTTTASSTGGSVKAPKLLEGGDQTIVAGSPLTIKTNGRIEEYLYTRINGEIIPEKYLTLKSGSVIVTLKPDYTSTLPAGEHEISVVSNTGATKTTFTIANSSDDSTTAMETLTPATEVATTTTPIAIKENPSTGR